MRQTMLVIGLIAASLSSVHASPISDAKIRGAIAKRVNSSAQAKSWGMKVSAKAVQTRPFFGGDGSFYIQANRELPVPGFVMQVPKAISGYYKAGSKNVKVFGTTFSSVNHHYDGP